MIPKAQPPYKTLVVIAVSLLLFCASASAQFSVTGSSPASIRWHQMETRNFKLIYPESMDSLAREYGAELEKARLQNVWSSGLSIGQSYNGKMPVVLHGFNTVPNASVTWAPRRIDIFTVPDAYSPTPVPWEKHLAVHEGRHAAQMQFGAAGLFRPLRYVVGEMFAGAMAGLYPGPAFLEGDAVVAETALSSSGRGRQSSFLNYMMPAFDCGDFRDYWRWVYGSQKLYTPDYYRAGYLLVAGTRVFFDDPLFTQEYFDRVIHKGWFFNLQHTVKNASGMKFNQSFRSIEKGFHSLWFAEAMQRGPYMNSRQVSARPGIHTDYLAGTFAGEDSFFALKSSLSSARTLVSVKPDGSERCLRPFSSSTSDLFYDPVSSRVYWTETVPHWRWTLKSDSRVRYVSSSDPKKIHDLTKEGKYFNCQPSPDGSLIAAIDYPVSGGSRLCLLSAADGTVSKTYTSPDSLQFTESVWIGVRLFASALSEGGMGIYEITGRSADGKAALNKILGPQPVELDKLSVWPEGSCLSFTCDRTGVKELYVLNILSGQLRQVTSSRYGISRPFLNAQADTLYYSSIASSHNPLSYRQGRMVYATAVSDLPVKTVSFDDIHRYPVADILTMQEKRLAGSAWKTALDSSDVGFSEPKKYSKIRFPRFHSWAPVYFNYDNVDDISSDEYYKTASLGAAGLFQNLFGDGYGFVGYSYHEDSYSDGPWRHSGHMKYVYSGLLPEFELSADFNDRDRFDIQRVYVTREKGHSLHTRKTIGDEPYLNVGLKAYVPINLSSGGVSRGLIPQVKYTFTNDRYNDVISLEKEVRKDGKTSLVQTGTKGDGGVSCFSSLTMSLRGYAVRPTASSQIYPSLGIGAEVGFHARPGHSHAFKNAVYFYTYGYLPGFIPQQGIRLSALFERNVGGKGKYLFPEGVVSTLPRGFVNSNLQAVLNLCSIYKSKATFDYAIPLFPVDWSFLGPVAYIRNFELTPFCDCAYMSFSKNVSIGVNPKGVNDDFLLSAGADFNVRLGNFLWLPYDTRIGFRYAQNFWSHLDDLSVSGLNHNYFGWTFTVSM